MTFPLMPFAFSPTLGVLQAIQTNDTSVIKEGDFLAIIQTANNGVSIDTPPGATVLIDEGRIGQRVKGSVKIADLSDIGTNWDDFSAVLILRQIKNRPLLFTPDVGSGTIDTTPYGRPVGGVSMAWRNNGSSATVGTFDGKNPNELVDIQRGGELRIVAGIWVGDFGDDGSVNIVDGISESGGRRRRLIYAT
ncbi:MAG: hypothetical protein EP336_09510 [Rhodobacteraceae bacterium]|nr:MAG: hypothetical protein EP336_09510 [Paracoccaceae bacterium]